MSDCRHLRPSWLRSKLPSSPRRLASQPWPREGSRRRFRLFSRPSIRSSRDWSPASIGQAATPPGSPYSSPIWYPNDWSCCAMRYPAPGRSAFSSTPQTRPSRLQPCRPQRASRLATPRPALLQILRPRRGDHDNCPGHRPGQRGTALPQWLAACQRAGGSLRCRLRAGRLDRGQCCAGAERRCGAKPDPGQHDCLRRAAGRGFVAPSPPAERRSPSATVSSARCG
jgi:hypothetical protein